MSQPRWDGRGKGTPLGNRLIMAAIRRTGVLPAYLMLVPACVSYALFDRESKAGLRALRRRLGMPCGLPAYYRHFFSFGMALIDRFACLLLDKSTFAYTCRREELISVELSAGQGAILLGAHVGNWEIAGNLLSERLRTPLNVVLLDAEREALQRIYRPALARRRFRVITLTPGAPDATVEIVARLRAGEVVCMLGDRLLLGRQATVDFLGAPARFPIGPFALSAATGAPVIPVFTVKTGLRHYTFSACDPIRIDRTSRAGRDDALRAGTRQFASCLETIVRTHPYQWYNFYDFWA